MLTTRRWTAAGAVAVLAGTVLASPLVGAAVAPEPTKVAKKLVSPLSMVVASDGTTYVSQNFAGLLTAIEPGRKPQVVFKAPKGTEVGALSESGGVVRLATTAGKKTALWTMRPGGAPKKLANLWKYEKTENPDAEQAYGFTDLDAACLAQMPPEVPGAYTGTPTALRCAAGRRTSPTRPPTRSSPLTRTATSRPSPCSRRSR